jgi:hypothetical protein
MRRKVRRIHWHTAENEKTNNSEVIKDQTDCIFTVVPIEVFLKY